MADKKISALTGATTPLAGTEVLPIVQSGSTVKVAVSDLTSGRAVATGDLTVTGKATTTTDLGVGTTSTNSAGVDRAITVSGTTNAIVEVNYGATRGSYLFANASTAVLSAVGAIQLKLNTDDTPRIAIQPTTGDIWAMTGNVVPIVAGKGVNFTANTPAAGMTSQLLNWYEEGTFTPTLRTDGDTNFTSVTYNAISFGSYTRVGKVVEFEIRIYTDAVTVGGASGSVVIGGLPFVPVNIVACSVGNTGAWTINFPSSAQVGITGSSATVSLFYNVTSNGGRTPLPIASVATNADSNLIYVAGTYRTS